MYLRELHTYLFDPPSRIGHLTPRPTLWALCLFHILLQIYIILDCRGNPLFGRSRAKTTRTKTPVLAFHTQAETARGFRSINLRISAGSSRMKLTKGTLIRKLHEILFSVLKKMFNVHMFISNCALQLQDDVAFKDSS